MKIAKSTLDCQTFNTINSAAISAGLMEAIEPDEATLKAEKAAESLKIKGESKQTAAKAVFESLGADVEMLCNSNSFISSAKSIRLEIEAAKGGSPYYPEFSFWKLVIGDGYGRCADKKWMKIGNQALIGLTAEQETKAKKILAEIIQIKKQEKLYAESKKQQSKRNCTFFAENTKLCEALGIYNYYDTGWNVNEDDKISIKGQIFTKDQWQQVIVLKTKHKEEFAALYEEFKMPVAQAVS